MKYESHPLADALPAMSEAEYQGLLGTIIQAKGLLDPIILYQGKVLDGRHRLRACEEAGIEPRFEEYTGNDPMGYVLAKNITRRHLTTSQKAMALLNLNEIVSQLGKQAEQRKRNNLKKGKQSPIPSRDGIEDDKEANPETGNESDSRDVEPRQHENKHATSTSAQLGTLADVSEKTIERAKYVREHGTPQDVEEVQSGQASVNQKAKEIRARQKNKTESGTNNDSRHRKRQRRESEDSLIVKEWRKCLQAVTEILGLDASNLPPGNTKDRVARFLRGLEGEVLSPEDRDEMKAAVKELRDRCQQVLRKLATAKKKSEDARPRRRSQAGTTTARRFWFRPDDADLFGLG